ncbi:MAG: hypothetical protein H3C48_10510 [Chitinophagaceae bacterium]|nr:hypothetical protein [Chitinophagaceae bacterium]
MKYTIQLLLCFMASVICSAQKKQFIFAGAGIGLDHGGLGIKAEYQPFKYLGLFGGVGHNLAGFNGNGGIIYNIMPNKKVTPIFTTMLGVNSAIIAELEDANGPTGQKSRLQFVAFTVGGGFDIKFGRQQNQKVNFTLLVPLRGYDFWWYRNYITNTLGGTIKQDVYPVLIAAGWNIDLLHLKRKDR